MTPAGLADIAGAGRGACATPLPLELGGNTVTVPPVMVVLHGRTGAGGS